MSKAETIMLTLRFDGARFKAATWRMMRAFRALERERRRKQVEAWRVLRGLPPVPGWIDEDPPSFEFPFWSPRWRPFDWAEDFGGWRVTTLTAQVVDAAQITAPVLTGKVVNAFGK